MKQIMIVRNELLRFAYKGLPFMVAWNMVCYYNPECSNISRDDILIFRQGYEAAIDIIKLVGGDYV